MLLLFHHTTLLTFNFSMLLCGNNALKQKTVHSSMTFCINIYNHIICKIHIHTYMSFYASGTFCMPLMNVQNALFVKKYINKPSTITNKEQTDPINPYWISRSFNPRVCVAFHYSVATFCF
jgi:hypothetical protein